MKNYTSHVLKAVALLYMAFPAAYLTFAALLFDIPAGLCVRILLSPTYYLLSLMAILAGYGLWEMRWWSWYLFVTTNVLVAYANAVLVTSYGTAQHKVIAYFLSLGIVAGLTYRIAREIKVPYFMPRIRWWESNPRYKLSAPVTLTRDNEAVFEGEILDLSMTGCFVKLKQDLRQDEYINLKFPIFGETVEASGTVVWRSLSTVTHPKGAGVKFGPLPRVQRRKLRAIVHRLKKITAFYRSSRYLMSQEEFFKRLDELQTAKLNIHYRLPTRLTDLRSRR